MPVQKKDASLYKDHRPTTQPLGEVPYHIREQQLRFLNSHELSDGSAVSQLITIQNHTKKLTDDFILNSSYLSRASLLE